MDTHIPEGVGYLPSLSKVSEGFGSLRVEVCRNREGI